MATEPVEKPVAKQLEAAGTDDDNDTRLLKVDTRQEIMTVMAYSCVFTKGDIKQRTTPIIQGLWGKRGQNCRDNRGQIRRFITGQLLCHQ